MLKMSEKVKKLCVRHIENRKKHLICVFNFFYIFCVFL